MHQDSEGREDYHARKVESEVTLKSKSSSAVESLRQSESVIVLNAGGRSDEDIDSNISSPSSTYTGRKLSPSEPGVPQDAGINHIQSAREHRSSEINVASTTVVQTSSHRSIENTAQSSLVTIQGGPCPCGQGVATDQSCQCFSAPKLDSNELAECAHRAVESRRDCHELETESEFKLSLTAHSHSVRTVERSTSETAVLKIERQMDEDTDVPTRPSSPITPLPPRDAGIPQDAGADFIQSGCEHQSSGVDTASIALAQTSNHDYSTESEGHRPAQSFSCSDEPETISSAHVCLSLAQNNSNSPPSMDEAVESVQTSSSVSNEIWNSSFTLKTGQSLASIHEEPYGQDTTKDQPKQGSSSPKHEVDEEGVTADHMHQAVIESGCERQSLEVNDVSKTPESEHTWSPDSPESSEWHTQRQGRQQAHSSGIVVLQVGESNTTPPQFLDTAVKNTETSSPTPDDLRNSPMPEGTSTIGQTPLAGDYLQGAPDHDVTRDRYNSRSSSIPKFEDNKVDVSAGCVHQALVTRGDYHEQEMKSEVERKLAYHFCSVEILGQSTSDTVTGNNDRRMDKDADDTALPLSSTTVRPKLSICEADIPQDAATSSEVITVLTTSIHTSSHNSTVISEHVHRQPAQTSSCSDELPIDYKINQSQTTVPVHPFLAPGENNPTLIQPFGVVTESTQQPSPASDNIRNSPLPEGVSTTGETSSPATQECGELCGRDGDSDLPSQGSSTPKLKDDKEEISADCTRQVMKDTRDYKSDTTVGWEKESRVDAKVAVSISSSPNPGLKEPPSETSVPQDAAANHVQSEREYNFTEDITVSVMSVHASSNCLSNSSNGYAYLDNPSQQSNNPPDTMSVPPMHDGPCPPSPVFYEVHDSSNCSCMSRHGVIAPSVLNKGDSTAVVACDVVKKCSSDDDHPAPCAEGTPGVKPRQDDHMKAESTVISMICDSNTVQTSSKTENQDNTSCAADTRQCGPCACPTVPILSDDCGASTATTAPIVSPSADEQLTRTCATDCAHECPSATGCLPAKICC
ncbi:hypothetical protein BDR05DRAFT_75529 [Suillus weaverae]|nr:hypothetical protein BDR05DRAFT_75529 [Suillus weaverae]